MVGRRRRSSCASLEPLALPTSSFSVYHSMSDWIWLRVRVKARNLQLGAYTAEQASEGFSRRPSML